MNTPWNKQWYLFLLNSIKQLENYSQANSLYQFTKQGNISYPYVRSVYTFDKFTAGGFSSAYVIWYIYIYLDVDYRDAWTSISWHKGSEFAGNFVGKRDKRKK
jgi:hypothetical protein